MSKFTFTGGLIYINKLVRIECPNSLPMKEGVYVGSLLRDYGFKLISKYGKSNSVVYFELWERKETIPQFYVVLFSTFNYIGIAIPNVINLFDFLKEYTSVTEICIYPNIPL